MINTLYFMKKAPFVLEIFKFLYFSLPLILPQLVIALSRYNLSKQKFKTTNCVVS